MRTVDFKRLALVLSRPTATLRNVNLEKPLLFAILIYLALPLLFFGVERIIFADEYSLWALFTDHPSNMHIWIELLYPILPTLILGGLLLFLVTRMFKPRGGFLAHFCTYAYSLVPLFLIIPLIFLANILWLKWPIDLIFYCILIWHAALVVIVVKEVHSVSLVSSIIIFILFLLLALIVGAATIYIYYAFFWERPEFVLGLQGCLCFKT